MGGEKSRGREMVEWLVFRIILPFGLPVFAGWVLVSTLADGQIKTPDEPNNPFLPPDWSIFWVAPKILLVGLLVAAGAVRDLWTIRESGQRNHTVAFVGLMLAGLYATLVFASHVAREVLQMDPAGNSPWIPAVTIKCTDCRERLCSVVSSHTRGVPTG